MSEEIGDPVTRLLVVEAYSAWLAAENKERSAASAGLYAFEATDFGTCFFEGLSESELCELIGGALIRQR